MEEELFCKTICIPKPPPLPPMPKTLASGYETTPRATFEPVKLHFAINNGDFETAKKEVERNIDLNYMMHGYTPLLLCIVKEHYDIAELLIKSGADTTKTEKFRLERQPIHVACKMGAYDTVKVLLRYGASVHACDKDDNTPLNVAAYEGYNEIIKLLCESGAHINTKDGRGKTPLFNAVENDRMDAVKLLLSEGGFVNTHDNFGWTPLIHCIVCGYLDLAKLLILHGANVNDPDRFGETPLHFACARLTSSHMNCLRRANLDYYTRHLDVVTPVLRRALQSTVTEFEFVALLVDHGCHLNVLNGFGQSPLCIAANEGNAQVVEYLLGAGASVNEEDWIGEGEWPQKLEESQHVCDLITQLYLIKIRSLQELCKFAIRGCLGRGGRSISDGVMILPFPDRIKNFLHV